MTHLLVKVSLFSKSLKTFSKLVIWSDNRRLRAKSLVAALVHESAEHFGLRSNFHLCCVMLPRYPHRHFFQRILMENYDSTVMHLLKQFLFHTGSLWDDAEPKKVLTTRIFCVTKRWKSRTHYISLSSNKLHERLIKTIKFTDELSWYEESRARSLHKIKTWNFPKYETSFVIKMKILRWYSAVNWNAILEADVQMPRAHTKNVWHSIWSGA